MTVDIEQFKESILASSEVDIDFTELIQNIQINSDGNIESHGDGLHVIMSQEYEILVMGGGVSPAASKSIMDSLNGCE